MPQYTYTDSNNNLITVNHPINWDGKIINADGEEMWRLPSKISGVAWGDGLSPSAMEQQSPEIRNHIQNASRERETYQERKQNG